MENTRVIITEISRAKRNLERKGINTDGLFYGVRQEENDEELERYVWQPEDSFLKVFPQELRAVIDKLKGPETLILLAIMPYISYDSGLLKKANGCSLAISDIAKIVDIHEKTVVKTVTRLVQKQMLYRGKTGDKNAHEFFANPYVFMKGKYINKTLRDMFKNYKGDKT